MHKSVQYLLILASIFCTLGGCTIYKQIQPISPVFLEGATLNSTVDRVPFQHAWSSSNPGAGIRSVFVRPVRIDLLPPDSWIESTSLGITSVEDYNRVAQSLAGYFDVRLREELQLVYERSKRLAIRDAPSQDSVILEIAITEMILSRPVSHAVGMAAPVPGLGMAMSAMHEPHVAFAARFLSPDGATLLGTLADRRLSAISPSVS